MGDPRVDDETKAYWDELTATLRAAVTDAAVGEPGRAALFEVLDLHVAWEFREQQVGNDDPDRILGIRCRSCENEQADWVPLHYRPCLTMTRLEATLLPHPEPKKPGSLWTHRDTPDAVLRFHGVQDGRYVFAAITQPIGGNLTRLTLSSGPGLYGLSPFPADRAT